MRTTPYTIAQRGLVDEKVIAALNQYRAFEHPVNLDGSHVDEVSQMIEDAALRPEAVNWREIENKSAVMAAEDEVKELESALCNHLPWTVQWASKERQLLESMPPAPPVLKDLPIHSALGPQAWDRALEGMLELLSRAGDYHLRGNTDPETGSRFSTLWYRFGEPGMYGRRPVVSRVVFSFGADPGHERSPRYAHAFITRRGDIGSPPLRSVTMVLDRDYVRPRRFLSFGDALHDELVRGWLPQKGDLVSLDVLFFEDHDLWKHTSPGIYLIRLAVMDPAAALLERGMEERAHEAVARAVTRCDAEKLLDLMRHFTKAIRCALEADVRWLRAVLTASMNLEVRRRQQDRWSQVELDEVRALLNPMAHDRNGVPRSTDLPASEEDAAAVEVELARQRQADATAARSAWSHRFPDFEHALAARLRVVEEEGRDAVALASEELRRAEDALKVSLERGNRAQITRAENIHAAAADNLDMMRVFGDERAQWLRECDEQVRVVLPQEHLTALIRARKVG